MGTPTEWRRESPTLRAAKIGMILAGGALALVLVVPAVKAILPSTTEWRDASVPTYPAQSWTGEARQVATALTLDLVVPSTLCPTATGAADGRTVGVVLADSWRGTYPVTTGVQQGYQSRLEGGPDDLLLEADPHGKAPIAVSGRVLDLSVPADAALAEPWTAACGAAEAFVMAAPDGLTGGRVGSEG